MQGKRQNGTRGSKPLGLKVKRTLKLQDVQNEEKELNQRETLFFATGEDLKH